MMTEIQKAHSSPKIYHHFARYQIGARSKYTKSSYYLEIQKAHSSPTIKVFGAFRIITTGPYLVTGPWDRA